MQLLTTLLPYLLISDILHATYGNNGGGSQLRFEHENLAVLSAGSLLRSGQHFPLLRAHLGPGLMEPGHLGAGSAQSSHAGNIFAWLRLSGHHVGRSQYE